MSSVPAFLNLNPAQQRAKFSEITRTCEKHLDEASRGKLVSEYSVSEAMKSENMARNRYSNVFPWDKTRIKLPVFPGAKSDYINASEISLDRDHRYIAAQGPLVTTVPHFWAMAFHEADLRKTDTVVIAMMTPLIEGGREKCARYWPSQKNHTWDFTESLRSEGISPGSLKLTVKSTETVHHGDLILTELVLDSPTTVKRVLHYQYKGWEDTKVPDSVDPILALSSEISKITEKDPAVTPIVHCSAGVGRTGTYIAIDYMLHGPGLKSTGDGDPIFEVVSQLRRDRMMMVQTAYQYMFLYDVARRLYEESGKRA